MLGGIAPARHVVSAPFREAINGIVDVHPSAFALGVLKIFHFEISGVLDQLV
jgi:hypothetical protein